MTPVKAIAATALAIAAVAVPVAVIDGGTPGAVKQLEGDAGCLKGTAGKSWHPCKPTVRGMYNVSALAISPDGRFVYGASINSGQRTDGSDIPGGTIVSFKRNAETGELTQVHDCIKDAEATLTGVTRPCLTNAKGLSGAKGIELSPDGRFAYVAALNNGSIAAFSRDQATGELTQLAGDDACVETAFAQAKDHNCARTAIGIDGVRELVVLDDYLYAAAPTSDAITAFKRDPASGAIKQLEGKEGCLRDRLNPSPACQVGPALHYPRDLAVAPDGKNLYSVSDSADGAPGGDAVAAFKRDPSNGQLRQLAPPDACIRDVQSASTTLCPKLGRGILKAFGVTVSQDNRFVHVGATHSGTGSIATFKRGPDGALSQSVPGCVGGGQGCEPVVGIKGADRPVLSGDGKTIYGVGFFGLTLTPFRRDPETGVLTQLEGDAKCVDDLRGAKGTCPRTARGLDGPRIPRLSPDGKHLYVPSSTSGTIAVFEVEQPAPEPTTTEPPPPEPTVTEPPPPAEPLKPGDAVSYQVGDQTLKGRVLLLVGELVLVSDDASSAAHVRRADEVRP